MHAEGDIHLICPESDCKRLYSTVAALRTHCKDCHPQAKILTCKRSSSISTAEVTEYQEQLLRVFRDDHWVQDTSGRLQLPKSKVGRLPLLCV